MRVESVEEIKFHTNNGWFKNYENFESMPEKVQVKGYIYIWAIIIIAVLLGYAIYFSLLLSGRTSFQLPVFLMGLVAFGIIIKMARDKIVYRTKITLLYDRIVLNGETFYWDEVESMRTIYYSNIIGSNLPPSIGIKLISGRSLTFVHADLSTKPGYTGDLPRILYMFWQRGINRKKSTTLF